MDIYVTNQFNNESKKIYIPINHLQVLNKIFCQSNSEYVRCTMRLYGKMIK